MNIQKINEVNNDDNNNKIQVNYMSKIWRGYKNKI